MHNILPLNGPSNSLHSHHATWPHCRSDLPILQAPSTVPPPYVSTVFCNIFLAPQLTLTVLPGKARGNAALLKTFIHEVLRRSHTHLVDAAAVNSRSGSVPSNNGIDTPTTYGILV
jgi:hypothetical protein